MAIDMKEEMGLGGFFRLELVTAGPALVLPCIVRCFCELDDSIYVGAAFFEVVLLIVGDLFNVVVF